MKQQAITEGIFVQSMALVATHLILMLASLLISTWLFIRIAEKGGADICDKSRGVRERNLQVVFWPISLER